LPVIKLKDFSCHYLQLQPENQTNETCRDLVMVHGLATNLAFWYPLAPAFTKTHRVTLFDLRGHGKSSMPSDGYTPKQMAEDLKELMNALKIKTADLLGHSFGGSVVSHLATEYPEVVDRLILADIRLKLFQPQQQPSNWSHWEQLKPALEEIGISLDENETEAGYRLLKEIARLQAEKTKDKLPELLSKLFPQIGSHVTAKHWLKLLDTTTAWQDFTSPENIAIKQLEELNKPTLAIYGEYSPTLPTVYGLQKIWAHLIVEIIPQAGHFFPLSKPKQFTALVENFLKLN
jgi:pimeloyl-ACP methyl ester carboxylesterase